ncbi:hypothetical protein EYR38_008802 [Pleurotus pulmonarius]|nr:hypothetical protein EYR38_008802 [Pleurotus pulmonarius]
MNAARHWSEETNAKDNENHWSYNTDAGNETQEIGDAVGWGDSWGDSNDDSTPTAETGGDTHWASSEGNASTTNDTTAYGWGDTWGDDNVNDTLGSNSADRAVGWDKTSNDINATALGWGDSWGNTDAKDDLPSGADQGSTSNDGLSTAPGWGDSWGDSSHNNLGGSNASGDSESNEVSETAPGWGDVDATNGWGTISTHYGVGSTASHDKGARKHDNAEASSSKLDKPRRLGKSSRALERANSNEVEAHTNPTTTTREVCKLIPVFVVTARKLSARVVANAISPMNLIQPPPLREAKIMEGETLWEENERAELPQGSPGHVVEETNSTSNQVMTPCHYFKQGYCHFEDRCRFLHTREEDIDEVAHIPAEQGDEAEVESQSPEPIDGPVQLPQPDPVFLEMDTEPTSTMRSFSSASIRFSHRGHPSHIVTAFESSRILLTDLPFHITRDDVERLVSQFGVVKGLMMLEPTPDAVAALVEFNHSEEAEVAAAQLDNLAYQGRSLSARQDRRGFLQNVGTAHGGYHVRLSWNAPSRVAWAFYNSITLAKTEAAKLGTIRFDSRQIKATFERPRKNQTSAYAVKIAGLPLNTDRRRLQEFCVGSTSVTIGEPTYVDDSLGPIRELLARHGTLHSLEPVPLEKENTKVVAIAQFLLAEAAASAAFNLNGLTPDIIGHNMLSAQHIHLSVYTIPRREYVAIKKELDAIKAGLGESCRIQCCEHIDPPRLYVYSEDANAYTSAKVQIERLVIGDLLASSNNIERWDPYLETPRGMRQVDTLNADPDFFIRVDALKKQIRILGGPSDRERAKKLVNSLFSTLRKSRHRLPLPRDVIAPLLAGELQSLKELFPINNVTLDVAELVLTAWGKLETIDNIRRAIRRLEVSTPHIASHPHNRVVCPSCWRPPVDAITIPCGHTYCKTCLYHLILDTGGSSEGARCIGQVLRDDEGGEAAFCYGDVPYSALRTILAPEEESTLLHAAFAAFVRDSSNGLHFCPSPGCEVVYRKREPGIVIACPSCLSRICPSCETFYHEGISCQQFSAVSPHL